MNTAARVMRRTLYATLMASLCLTIRPQRRLRFRLAVLKLDRLGDAVLSLGAVRRLTAEFGEKETLLIVSTIAAPLYRTEFPRATLLVLPPFCKRFWPDLFMCLIRHAAKLRAISAETLVCLRHQHSDYLHAVAHLLEAERCHAARWQHGSERTSLAFPRCRDAAYPDAAQGACLEVEAHRRVVASAIGADVALEEVLPALASGTPGGGGGLLICPGAGDAIREYPAPLLARAIGLFLEMKPGIQMSICLPPGERRQFWKDGLSECRGGRVRWLLPESFEALAAAIANADVVLAPDSAPAHLATALNKPGVFLLGGGHFGMFAPWGKSGRQVWLRHDMDCYQCRWNCRHPEPWCITRIQPESVAQALLLVAGGCADS
jgi:ADP-heptose:LPS heptosyltransferase